MPWDLESRVKLGDASVARSPEAAYEVRVDAAKLAPASGLGSAELDFLASGASQATAAEKPHFYFARLKAAEAADARERIRLLQGALAINPQAKPARLLVFRAALANGDSQLAVSSLEPLIGYLEWARRQPESENDSQMEYYSREFLAGQFDAPGRAAIARGLGGAEANLGELGAASLFYRIALRIEPSVEADVALARVKAEQERRAENVRRRPVIKDELGQERLVQPRLVEGGSSK